MACRYQTIADQTPDIDHSQNASALSRALTEAGHHVGSTTIKTHRLGQCACTRPAKPKPETRAKEDKPADAGRVEVGPDGGSFEDVKTDKPISDWGPIFERFKLDPSAWIVDGGSIRLSHWQQSARTADGDRDVIDLYSYRAKFRRKPESYLTPEDIEELQQVARSWHIPKTPRPRSGTPIAAVLNLADMQLFKAEGGGVQATMERLTRALEAFQQQITTARHHGLNVDELVIVNNGDPFEGIAGNYANQNHTVQGGLRAQMNAVLDVWMMFARTLYPMFAKRQFVSVLCNHTQFGRQGGAKDAITGDEDNGSAFLAETLQRILDATPGLDDVRFTIPHDEMNVFTRAAGIELGFNHGHKIPGSGADGFEKWLNGQVRYDDRAYGVRVWITAHRHNFQMFDLGSTAVLQCPSCDGGSKWLTDRTGKHSNAGVVSLFVGEHHRLGWSDVAFL